MDLLTKVAKGVAFGDVSNQAIRNILTEISKSICGNFTEQEMVDTLDYFGWKCPYTGIDLKQALENGDSSKYETDHIYPQNRTWCGLNVKGNLVIVDKEANSAKGRKDIKTFFEEDSKFWEKHGVDKMTRAARLQKIQEFQKDCGYDPEMIRKTISPFLEIRYKEIRDEQEKSIQDTLNALKNVGIYAVKSTPASATASQNLTAQTNDCKKLPELIFYPSNEQQFKIELLKSKKAHFDLTYDTGIKKTSPWNAVAFASDSDLRKNIQSRPFWRNKDKEGLVKVEVYID